MQPVKSERYLKGEGIVRELGLKSRAALEIMNRDL
jgi:hypothetical protein